MSLSRCPEPALAGVPFRGVAVSAAAGSTVGLLDELFIATTGSADTFACGGDATPLLGSYSASALFRAPAASGALSISLAGVPGGALVATPATLPVVVLPTLWPLWDDSIACTASGVMVSVALGTRDGTAALLAALPACAAGGAGGGGCSVAAALARPATVLAAAAAVYGGDALPVSSSARVTSAADVSALAPFAMTLAGSAVIVLRARVPAFSQGATASVGSAPCTGVTASADGLWLYALTPSSSALCGADAASGGECGTVFITVSNAATAGGARRLGTTNASATALAVLGAALSCPPFCPGAESAGIIHAPVASAAYVPGNASGVGVSFAPALASSVGARGANASAPLLIDAAAFSTTSNGLYYAGQCAPPASGVPWTDPTTGACLNASDPASRGCAFGVGSSCSAVRVTAGEGQARALCGPPPATRPRSARQTPSARAALARGLSRATGLPRRASPS